MAATVIDELVVLLNLDPTKFSEGQKKVAEEFVRLKTNAERATREAQNHTESLTKAFTSLQGKLLGIAALFLGGMGIKQFGEHVANLTNQLGRLSTQAGTTATDLSAWGNAGAAVGANPGAVRAGVQGLAAAGNAIEPNTQLYQTLAAMGIAPRRLPNGDFDVNGTLLAMSQWAAQKQAAGMGTGRITGALMRVPGMNADLASTLLQGPEKLQAELSKMAKYGPTPEDVKAIQDVNKAWAELQAKFERFTREIETHFAPVITWLINKISSFFDIFHANVKDPDKEYDRLHNKLTEKFGTVDDASKAVGDPGFAERFRRWVAGGGMGHVTPPEERGASVTPGVNGAPTPSAPGASGGIDRSRFRSELERNPALRDKVLRIAANEQGRNPEGTQAIIESMMNRAEMRGTTLAAQARWHSSEGGYYEEGNMGRGALENPAHRAVLERSLANALGNSNISNYATDNASGDLARRERANGKFTYQNYFNGETFFSPGWGGGAFGPASRSSYEAWRARLQDNDKIWQTHGGLFLGSRARDLNVMGNSTSNQTSLTTSQTHVGEVNVHVPNGDPYSIAKGIHGALLNVSPVAQANTGPW